MTGKSPFLYQGRDWHSYRWCVAEAFDALDQFHDFCLAQGWRESEEPAEAIEAFLPALLDLGQEVVWRLDLAATDTLPPTEASASLKQGWTRFEMDQCAQTLQIELASLGDAPGSQGLASLLMLASTLKNYLKRLDQ